MLCCSKVLERRERLHVITQNCIIEVIYHDLGIKLLSLTINMSLYGSKVRLNYMIFLLIFLLLIMLALSYIASKKIFLSPHFVLTTMFFLSACIVAININYWEYDISHITVLVIIGALTFFGLGQLLGEHLTISSRRRQSVLHSDISVKYMSIPKSFIIVSTLFGLVVMLLYFKQQYSNGLSIGSVGSISDLIRLNRYGDESEFMSATYLTLFIIIFETITYFVLFVSAYRSILLGKKVKYFSLLPLIVIYGVIAMLSTNRSDIIIFASSIVFVIAFAYYSKADWQSKSNRKMIRKILFVFVVALFIFRSYGYLSGKSEMYSFYDNVSIYVGSSNICLDMFLTDKSSIPSNYNPSLFKGFYNLLGYLGIHIQTNSYALPHQYWNHGASNVFTSLMPYIAKFGIGGMLAVEFGLGTVYGVIWRGIRTRRYTLKVACIYGMFFYFLTVSSIAERMISEFFTLTSIVKIIVLLLLWKWFVRLSAASREDIKWSRDLTR